MADLQQLADAVISGQAPKVAEMTTEALDQGVSPTDVLNKGLIAGMQVVGVKFKNNEFYVPEVLIAARAMKAGMKILRPKLAESGIEPTGRFVIGTVTGDLHDIGKNLVSMMIEGAGYEVIDLGVDVAPDTFIQAVKEHQPVAIGMSALLTTTMVNMKKTIEAFENDGMRDQVKILVGGAPLTDDYAKEIGADGYAPDAASVVELLEQFNS